MTAMVFHQSNFDLLISWVRSKVILPDTANLGETLKQILERHHTQTIFKPIFKLSTVLSSGKDTIPASKCQGVIYEIPCGDGDCEHKDIGETKQSLSTW